MTKKADVNLLWYLIGIVLAGIVVFFLIKFWSKILSLFVPSS